MKVKNERELQNYFQKDLGLRMGYVKILKEDVGRFRSPFPDFWAIGKDRFAEAVEIEVLSYNFVLHGHDIGEVDKVYYAINNHALYGISLPNEFVQLEGIEVVDTYFGGKGCRTYVSLRNALTKSSEYYLSSFLNWFQPLDKANSCVVCGKGLALSPNVNRVVYSEAKVMHNLCLKKIREKIISLL